MGRSERRRQGGGPAIKAKFPSAIPWLSDSPGSSRGALGLAGFGGRKRKMKGCPVAHARGGPHLSPMSFDDGTAERKTKSHAALFGGGEWLEQIARHVFGEARPIVGDIDMD